MTKFHVELKKIVDDSYDVEIGSNLSDKLIDDLKDGLVGNINKYVIITDSIVKDLYAQEIYTKLIKAGYKSDIIVFEAGEKNKTRKTKEFVEDSMLEKGYKRDCCIIAVGGGVVTDLSGFVAGTFGRGVPFINYATTLLAAADASIGGKTAVDTDLATNLIGLFNEPQKVYIDTRAWSTLPERQLSSGLSETIKHGCISDYEFFEFLEKNIHKVFEFDNEVCDFIAKKNCEIKYNVVMKDEKEKSLREVLNLGHTVGRAIETVSDYKLLHGEALAIGMVAQVMLGNKLGYISEEDKDRVINLYKKAKLPTTIPDYIDRDELIKKLYTDKKVRDNKIRFVFQKGIGNIVEFENETYATAIEEEQIKEIIMKM